MIVAIDILPVPYAEHAARDAIKLGLPHNNKGGYRYEFAANAAENFTNLNL